MNSMCKGRITARSSYPKSGDNRTVALFAASPPGVIGYRAIEAMETEMKTSLIAAVAAATLSLTGAAFAAPSPGYPQAAPSHQQARNSTVLPSQRPAYLARNSTVLPSQRPAYLARNSTVLPSQRPAYLARNSTVLPSQRPSYLA